MSNILVTGTDGQLGSEIKDLVKGDNRFFFTTKNELDISNALLVQRYIKQHNIKAIINCAAYTAVDKAEREKEFCKLINYYSVKNLALIAKQKDISLIHISTDYVFNGKSHKPYTEDDKTDPINFYGFTKLQGEKIIKEINPKNSIIIRTSWVYTKYGNNFVKTMLKLKDKRELKIVFDQIGTPTYAKDLAEVILKIVSKLKNDDVEIYHYSNEGVCSWYDFAKAIFELKDIDIKLNPIHTYEYKTLAKRPFYSVLDKTKVKKDFAFKIPYWRDSLKVCLKEMD